MREAVRRPALDSGRVDLFQQRFCRGADFRLFLQKFREKIFNLKCRNLRSRAASFTVLKQFPDVIFLTEFEFLSPVWDVPTGAMQRGNVGKTRIFLENKGRICRAA